MKGIRILVILVFALLVFQPAVRALNVDELLLDRLVEKGILTTEEAAALRADAAIKTQEELAARNKFGIEGKTPISVSGYLQALYNATEGKGVFDETKVRRARLDFRGDFSRDVSWRLQVDAVQPLKKVSGTNFVTRPILLDANIDYRLALATVRVGQFKLPFGRENLESSPKLDTINRSQVTEKLVPGRDIGSQGRDIGIQAGNDVELFDSKVAEYAVGLFNGSGINVGEENKFKDTASRLVIYPLPGLALGGDYYNGRAGTTEAVKSRTGIELVYLYAPFSLKGEYVSGKDNSTEKYGWYAQLAYGFFPGIEGVIKYDTYDPSLKVKKNRSDVTTYGVNWTLNKWARIQVNYEAKAEEGVEVDNNSFLVQSQVQF